MEQRSDRSSGARKEMAGVMAVGAGKWCWPSLLAFKEDKEGGTRVGEVRACGHRRGNGGRRGRR
jgi:hypothetical protein